MQSTDRYPWVWDYDLTKQEFDDILAGRLVRWNRLDQDWAATRLIEHADYREMIRRLGYRRLIEGWPRWRERVRADEQRRALDWLVEWLPTKHPELIADERHE